MWPLISMVASGAAAVGRALFGSATATQNQNFVTTLADKILPETDKERQAAAIAAQDEDIKDVESARSYNAPDMPVIQYWPGMGVLPFLCLWILDILDHLVDSLNHAIRPLFFIYLAVGFSGKVYSLPNPASIDAEWWKVFLIVVTFFYGGRTLVKDILPGIGTILTKIKK